MQNPVEIASEIHRFNVAKILEDIEQVIFTAPDFNHAEYDNLNQISLRAQGGWFGGTGYLYDDTVKAFTRATSDYINWNPLLEGTYLRTVLDAVEQIAEKDEKQIGRVRVMRLPPKSCLALHSDPEEYRYHIPLQTNHAAFFVVATEVIRMSMPGVIYRFKTDVEHTAVNASMKSRIHLVFDTF